MGKGLLVVILGLGVIISILEINLNANTNQGFKTTVDYYDDMQARLISNSGIEIYLEKLREDKTLSGTFNDNPLMSGSYDISISGPDTALKLKSIGKFSGVNHTSMILAKRIPIVPPGVNSSVYISSTNLSINFNGNVDISGNDHDMNGNPTAGTSLPGVGVNKASDSAYVVNNIKPKITKAITGSGGTPSVATIPDTTDWDQVTQNIIFAADYTLPTGTYSSGTSLGTETDPKITYVNGDVNFTGTSEGYGIMVVNGNLTLSGQFTFYGIIIVYGQSQITVQLTGNSTVYGATMFVGQSVDVKAAAGNATLYYCSAAINNARLNLKSSRFKILSWWE